MKTIFIAGLFHESHSFLSGATEEAEFTTFRGEDLVTKNQGAGSPLSAVLDVAAEKNWHVVPSVHSFATPGPKVEQGFIDKTFQIILADLEESIRRLDGIYLVLHGAMVGTGMDDVEGSLLSEIHRVLERESKEIPVCGVLDLHCNFTPTMAKYSSALIAYKHNPHTDAAEAAAVGAGILDRLVETGEHVQTAYRHPPIILPPVCTGTDDNPMRALLDAAREIKDADNDILATNIFGGFAYSDMVDTGLSFSVVTTGSVDKAQKYMDDLCRIADFHRVPVTCDEHNLDELLPDLRPSPRGPILLIEPSDNIGGGTPGDGTGLLSKLLEYRVENFAVVINDPDAVKSCYLSGLCTDVDLVLGGKVDSFHGKPVQVNGKVIRLSDGDFELENKHSHMASMIGTHAHMGACATLEVGNSRILVTSRKTAPLDLGQLRSQGIVPEMMSFIGIKAAIAHKAAYDPIAAQSYYVETPGLGTNNLKSLPYRKARRPIYPLDAV